MVYRHHENVEIQTFTVVIKKPQEKWLKSLSSLELPSICFASLICLSENSVGRLDLWIIIPALHYKS
jgi:hypothetical protein